MAYPQSFEIKTLSFLTWLKISIRRQNLEKKIFMLWSSLCRELIWLMRTNVRWNDVCDCALLFLWPCYCKIVQVQPNWLDAPRLHVIIQTKLYDPHECSRVNPEWKCVNAWLASFPILIASTWLKHFRS